MCIRIGSTDTPYSFQSFRQLDKLRLRNAKQHQQIKKLRLDNTHKGKEIDQIKDLNIKLQLELEKYRSSDAYNSSFTYCADREVRTVVWFTCCLAMHSHLHNAFFVAPFVRRQR